LENAFTATGNRLGYDIPLVTHNFKTLVLGFFFFARNTQSFGNAVNPFLLPELKKDEVNDATALSMQWDAVL